MKKYFLDTNCFDYLIDNQINIDDLKSKGIFYTSNVQYSELKNTPNQERSKELLAVYESLDQIKLQLKSGIWIDDLYWDDDQNWIDDQTTEFSDLQNNNLKNSKDALIGELTANSDILLVTSDKKFQKRCRKIGVNSIEIQEII